MFPVFQSTIMRFAVFMVVEEAALAFLIEAHPAAPKMSTISNAVEWMLRGLWFCCLIASPNIPRF
jgi:hypothetical protein